ncbi:F-box protein SKIP14 [Apostasia shenzhenica]|uniref:F-box protein SKIP14 n=1 Tax=Apostasia shenzhenica TaxID=1088818 RepID=A0A2I0AIV7_9ASPA|nr:F-box protein SKIP14 [Apostasia shenzhenica]
MMRERGIEGFRLHDWMNREINGSFGCGGCARDGERVESICPNDPINLLPADPFEMNLRSSTPEIDFGTTISAAIAGWIGAGSNDYEVDGGDLLAGFSYYWNTTVWSSHETHLSSVSSIVDFYSDGLLGLALDDTGNGSFDSTVNAEEVSTSCMEEDIDPVCVAGSLHEGLLLSLGYLGLQDLLSVERVCRSLRVAVQHDTLLWRCVHIDSPLSEKITDDVLYRLTQRAQGSLQCLSLLRCSRITDDGLKRVLDSNLSLKKLSIPGCLRLTVDGLVNNLKALKLSGMAGIKTLKLGRLFSVSREHFEELRSLVGAEELHPPKVRKLQFFHHRTSSSACEDDRAIDIEICPICGKCKLVFDCPSESCQKKGPEFCRACDTCISRCIQCGRCVNNCTYMETFCLEYLCSGCWKNPSQNQDIILN